MLHLMKGGQKLFKQSFLAYNATYPSEPKYLFPEFVEHYVWDTQSNVEQMETE